MKKRKYVVLLVIVFLYVSCGGCAGEIEQEIQDATMTEIVGETGDVVATAGADIEIGPRCIPGYTLGDITHPSYYECELSEESMEYLDKLIDLIDQGLYEDAMYALDGDKTDKIWNELYYVPFEGLDYEAYESSKLLYKDKKISIRCFDVHEDDEYNFDITILPLEDGTGCYLSLYVGGKFDVDDRTYLFGECSSGQFNGAFEIHRWEGWQDTGTRVYIHSTGTFKDGVLHGELINSVEDYMTDEFEWEDGHYEGAYEEGAVIKYTERTNYQNGFLVQSEIMRDNSNKDMPFYAVYGSRVYETGWEEELRHEAASEHYITEDSERLFPIDMSAFDGRQYYGYETYSGYYNGMWNLWY